MSRWDKAGPTFGEFQILSPAQPDRSLFPWLSTSQQLAEGQAPSPVWAGAEARLEFSSPHAFLFLPVVEELRRVSSPLSPEKFQC